MSSLDADGREGEGGEVERAAGEFRAGALEKVGEDEARAGDEVLAHGRADGVAVGLAEARDEAAAVVGRLERDEFRVRGVARDAARAVRVRREGADFARGEGGDARGAPVAGVGGDDVAEAERRYRRAIARDPDFPDAWLNLGRILFRQRGKRDEAEKLIRASLERAPESAAAHNLLGVAAAERGDLSEAETQFIRAVRLEPGRRDYEVNLSNCRRLMDSKRKGEK